MPKWSKSRIMANNHAKTGQRPRQQDNNQLSMPNRKAKKKRDSHMRTLCEACKDAKHLAVCIKCPFFKGKAPDGSEIVLK